MSNSLSSTSMALGRRCELGCESWPDTEAFKKCPECGEPTRRMSGLSPLALEEAQSVLRHYQFERAYEEHCRKLGQPVEGPLPEAAVCGD